VRRHSAVAVGRATRRVAALLGVLLAASAAAQQGGRAPVVELDRIVAVVNDDVIVASELEERVTEALERIQASGFPAPSAAELRRQVLERLVLERLQLQTAARLGIRVEDEALNRAVASIAERNGLTLREFRDTLERDGFDFGRFRDQVRNQILLARVRQSQVERRIRISERDIDNFLATAAKQGATDTEYRLAQILIALPDGASPEQIEEARRRAEAILERLRAGADFAQTAAAESDGQQALAGGDLGWRKAADLPTLFADLVPEMEPGDLRGPIRSSSGLHIIKLLERRDGERHIVTQTHARHILIRTNELVDDAEARARLEQLRLRLEGGDPFEDLARGHSEDPASAAEGGDLGWLDPGDVVPEFQEAMDALAPGEISEPVKTQFGWHLIQVLERRERDDTERARRAAAREQIRRRKLDDELQVWLRQLRDEAYVKYLLDEP